MRTFYLTTHRESWLERVDFPLFVSHNNLRKRKRLPRATCRWALDSGGFTEIEAHGRYRQSHVDYARAVRRYRDEIGGLDWAAPQDWMCEPRMTARTGYRVSDHQRLTVHNLLDLRETAADLPFVPVLQGWDRDDYLRCADLYAANGIDLTAEPTVGIGSVCRRQSTSEIDWIIRDVSALGIRLHGFGVKTGGLARYGPSLESADSLAWSYAARALKILLPECARGGTPDVTTACSGRPAGGPISSPPTTTPAPSKARSHSACPAVEPNRPIVGPLMPEPSPRPRKSSRSTKKAPAVRGRPPGITDVHHVTDDGRSVTVAEAVVVNLATMAYLETAAAAVGIAKPVLYEWMKRGARAQRAWLNRGVPIADEDAPYVDFVNNATRATEDAHLRDLATLSRMARGGFETRKTKIKWGPIKADGSRDELEREETTETLPPDVRAITWRLERRFRDLWWRRDVVEVTGANGEPLIPSDERARSLASALKEFQESAEAIDADSTEVKANGRASLGSGETDGD